MNVTVALVILSCRVSRSPADTCSSAAADAGSAAWMAVPAVPAGQRLPWRPDLALLGLHGAYGEDGQIQRELAALRIPYTGSSPGASQ